jgi:hypothetical protein
VRGLGLGLTAVAYAMMLLASLDGRYVLLIVPMLITAPHPFMHGMHLAMGLAVVVLLVGALLCLAGMPKVRRQA